MNAEATLRQSFTEILALPPDAVNWLCELWNAIQVLDDVADGDTIERADLDRAIYALFVAMPANPFYGQHQVPLLTGLIQMIMKWQASDVHERAGCADERSYMWRAGYYDVVCLVTALVHGPDIEKAWQALALYGEACAEYMKEFHDA